MASVLILTPPVSPVIELPVEFVTFVWKNIYCKQLIPGSGTVRKRLKNIWGEFKKDVGRRRKK